MTQPDPLEIVLVRDLHVALEAMRLIIGPEQWNARPDIPRIVTDTYEGFLGSSESIFKKAFKGRFVNGKPVVTAWRDGDLMGEKMIEHADESHLFVISLSPYAKFDGQPGRADFEVSRCARLGGHIKLGDMPRPGAESAVKQMIAIRAKAGPGRLDVVVIDDGCQSGKTFERVADYFDRWGFNVVKIVAGINATNAQDRQRLESRFGKIDSVFKLIPGKFLEIVDVADTLIGVGGKAVILDSGNNHNGHEAQETGRVPDLFPFLQPDDSMKLDKDAVIDFSIASLMAGGRFWRRLERFGIVVPVEKATPGIGKVLGDWFGIEPTMSMADAAYKTAELLPKQCLAITKEREPFELGITPIYGRSLS